MQKQPLVRVRSTSLILSLALTAACGGGGSGGGGGQTPVDPPAGAEMTPYVATLTSVAAGFSRARVHYTLPGTGFEAALFRSTNAATVFSSSPVPLTGSSLTVTGLSNGSTQFFGLGVRSTSGGNYTQSGAVLRALLSAPIYVDAAAAPGGSGSSPATAYNSIVSAVLEASFFGRGNIWVKDGTYPTSLTLFPLGNRIHLLGGFGDAFTLASRDPQGGNTVLTAFAGGVLIDVQNNLQSAVVDGFRLEGQNTASVGVDVDDGEVELRSLSINAFTDRGIRLRNALTTDELDIVIAACSVTRNGADGLSLLGAFDLRIHGSNFDANIQEGVELDDLSALDGTSATLLVEGSRFFGNGTDGLDADLAPPALAPATSGSFDIEIRASRFERNGQAGLLLDHDFESIPGYSADIRIRECIARGNRGAGIQIDGDGPGTIFLHGSLVSANVGDGLVLSSDSARDVAIVSSSAFTANLGAGVRTLLANRTVALSHCILAGNEAGGVIGGSLESGTTSSLFYLQPTASQNTRSWFDVVETDPLSGLFTNAPEEYLRVTGISGNELTVDGTPALMPGVPIELNDDGKSLTATMVVSPVITSSSVLADTTAPTSLTAFASMASVDEDYTLPGGSAGLGAGMTNGPSVDAGPFGAPLASAPGTPGEVRQPHFYPASSNPPPSTILGNTQTIEIDFSRAIQANSFDATTVRARRTEGGANLNIGIATTGSRLTITAPSGGWGTEDFVIELHRDLQASDGTSMTAPVAIPYQR